MTGQWEKRLKDIEKGEYSAGKFIREMKAMVDSLVVEVRLEKGKAIRHIERQVPPKKDKPKKWMNKLMLQNFYLENLS